MRAAVVGVLVTKVFAATAAEPAQGPASGLNVTARDQTQAARPGTQDRLARERGLDLRAVSRGMTPDAAVPTTIALKLRQDGFDLGQFHPSAFSRQDLEGARRIVSIGADTASVTAGSSVPVEVWHDIPPATERYNEARNALRTRIEALLVALSK